MDDDKDDETTNPTTNLDDLLRWDGSDGLLYDDTEGVDHSDGFDDLELWALEQKLTTNPSFSLGPPSSNVVEPDSTTATTATATTSTAAVVVEDDDSTSQEELSRLRREQTQLQEQMKKLQSSTTTANDSYRARNSIVVASTDDLLHRIHDLELEQANAQSRTEDFLRTIQRLETMNQQLGIENEELKASMKRMMTNNTLSSVDETPVPSTVGQVDANEAHIRDLKTVIENLQARIMVLVEEKLDLQLRNDSLEHEKKSPQKQPQHPRWFLAAPATNSTPKTGEAVVVEQQPPAIVDGEASQSDHLKQAMVDKQKRGGGSLGGIIAKVAGSDFVTNPVSAGGNKDSLSLQEKKAAQLEASGGDESLGLLTSPKKVDSQATGDDKQTSTKVVSPKKFGGWGSIFGSAKKKDSGLQGDEEDFMSTTTTAAATPSADDAPGTQLLLPALTSDTLPSMLDSNSVSSHGSVNGETLVDENETAVDVDDTAEFDADIEKGP